MDSRDENKRTEKKETLGEKVKVELEKLGLPLGHAQNPVPQEHEVNATEAEKKDA